MMGKNESRLIRKVVLSIVLFISMGFFSSVRANDNDPFSEVECTLKLYSGGSDEYFDGSDWLPGVPTWVSPVWVSIEGSTWVWSSDLVQNPTIETTVEFRRIFDIPECLHSILSAASIQVSADNIATVYLNEVYIGEVPVFDDVYTYSLQDYLQPGSNELTFTVTNSSSTYTSPYDNPAGLIYKVTISFQPLLSSCIAEDKDGDGYSIEAGDCDDSNPFINPDATELPGNEIDEDCNGSLGNCDPNAIWKNHGEYVRCVAHEVKELVNTGLITQEVGDVLVSSAAQSDIGKK